LNVSRAIFRLREVHQNLGHSSRTEQISREVICQVALALDFLHGQDIAHMNFHSEKILVTRDLTGTLIDFGRVRCQMPYLVSGGHPFEAYWWCAQ
jgi:serine/threonine protein kinase